MTLSPNITTQEVCPSGKCRTFKECFIIHPVRELISQQVRAPGYSAGEKQYRSEGAAERDIGSLRMMGWGLMLAENSSVAAVAVAAATLRVGDLVKIRFLHH